MVTEVTKKLLGVPDSFVDDIGGVTLSSFWPVLQVAFDDIPGDIVEIGADRGFVTERLGAICSTVDRAFYSIDPSPASHVGEIGGVHHMRMTSKEFFKNNPVAGGIWIVDGDHNYETVMMELNNISSLCKGRDTVVFLHDLGWPWGRRDLWYNPAERGSGSILVDGKRSISLDHPKTVSYGLGIELGAVSAVAEVEGGPKNGVLTALEDFLKSPEGDGWQFTWTPIFYGVGMLTYREERSQRFARLDQYFDAFNQVAPILSSLELNRLRLLQTLHNKWSDNHQKDEEIARLYPLATRAIPFIRSFVSRAFRKILGGK